MKFKQESVGRLEIRTTTGFNQSKVEVASWHSVIYSDKPTITLSTDKIFVGSTEVEVKFEWKVWKSHESLLRLDEVQVLTTMKSIFMLSRSKKL